MKQEKQTIMQDNFHIIRIDSTDQEMPNINDLLTLGFFIDMSKQNAILIDTDLIEITGNQEIDAYNAAQYVGIALNKTMNEIKRECSPEFIRLCDGTQFIALIKDRFDTPSKRYIRVILEP